MQLTRIYGVVDPNVTVVYITPFPISDEVMNKHLDTLKALGVENPGDRIHVLVAENYIKFSQHYSLAQQVYYSPFCLRNIRSHVMDKICYIVPGKFNEYDYNLSVLLGIPMLSGQPEHIAKYSSKSGAIKLFKELDIPTAPGASNIKSEDEFFDNLSQLVAQNLNVPGWLFKIDNEFSGRGHAWININEIRNIVFLKNQKIEMTESIVLKLKELLQRVIHAKAKIAMPGVYKTW